MLAPPQDATLRDASVPIEYVRPIADQLRSTGVDVEAWLLQSQVLAVELARPDGVVAYPVFQRLVRNALTAAREPALGLFVGQRLGASTHGMVGAAAVHSSTVRQALDVVERFSHLRTSLITISHELSSTAGRVLFKEALPLHDIQRPMLEAVVLSIKTVLDEITMGGSGVHTVAFTFEDPGYGALASDLFGCQVHYGQAWTGFSASPEVLDLPLKLADTEAFAEAARICQRELELIAKSSTWSARVRRLLLARQEQQGGLPSLQVTARLLHITPRTLHRRLLDERSSFRAELESVRNTLAVEHLKTDRFSVQEIAYRLGYNDLSNFRRAFKRWQGVPPSVYRQRLVRPDPDA